jgi:hypothetical protein
VSNKDSIVSVGVIYDHKNFICLLYTADLYQWGYDDGGTLQSHVLKGEVNQEYYNPAPDFTNKYYWVEITKNGCSQKSYYNPPSGVITPSFVGTHMEVFPDPANSILNVNIERTMVGDFTIQILDITGKVVLVVPGTLQNQIDISSMNDGMYMIACVSLGRPESITKFIKVGKSK